MKIQTFQPSTPVRGLGDAPRPEKPEPGASETRFADTFEHFGYAIGAGVISGLCVSSFGNGLGSLAGIAGSAVAVGATEGLRQGTKGETGGLPVLGGAIAGGAFGVAGSVGAVLGGFVGHPVVGGALAGALVGAASYFSEKS